MLQRTFLTSLSLPDARDYIGNVFWCYERGVDQLCPWLALGGANAVWAAQGPSYTGAMSGLPAAANLRIGARAIIDQPAPGGLTRQPTVGAKMNRIELEVKYLPDGTTKVWRPRGTQVLFQYGGTDANSAQSFTATGATGIISEIGQLPAGFASVAGSEVFWRLLIGRTTTLGTATTAISMGPTPGTIGSTLGSPATLTANVNAVDWLEGSFFVQASAAEMTTTTGTPQGSANIGTGGAITNNMALAQTLQVGFASATTNDNFTFIAGVVGLR